MKRGFTLIEAIVYMALLSFIMGGTLFAVWQIIQGEGKVDTRTTVQDEAGFVLHKLHWALSGIDPSKTVVPASGSSASLALMHYDGTTVDVCLKNQKIWIRENGSVGTCGDSSYLPITTSNVQVTSLQFQHVGGGSGPWGVNAAFILSGFAASTTAYIRT